MKRVYEVKYRYVDTVFDDGSKRVLDGVKWIGADSIQGALDEFNALLERDHSEFTVNAIQYIGKLDNDA